MQTLYQATLSKGRGLKLPNEAKLIELETYPKYDSINLVELIKKTI